mmetsp:Transcript_72064/g.114842  ORF Transcript_72064/g.114842 Transcript_72064/m.114842 type:complete len:140 (+) Transcript_72064:133-552(+)|eukprot:CAMPEP_0197021370 /NCGR_PEP_ID=MMETSP1384-20130603/2236_1 /TAXON_ID=29189 /ORGANISM="Ammonia sp." /LENGTH=139 /DNA_ID=CAMNT_0042449179 /DNA_START=118 /DNA_END=537 /DNA_ORIENTATION=-
MGREPRPVPRGWKKEAKPRPKRFIRWHSDRFKRVSTSWRKPRGIDSRIRRQWHGTRKMPSIGYRTAKRDRYRRKADGKYKFLVRTPGDLKMLMMYNDCFVAEFANTLSAKKRPRSLRLANQLGVRVINGHAKMQTREED